MDESTKGREENRMESDISKEKTLFPMKYIVDTCGISRATLLRMEEDGLLVPARKSEDSGYRYYDSENFVDIITIQQYQHLGFTKKEIHGFMHDPSLLTSATEALRRKYLFLLREMENMTANLGQPADSSHPELLNVRILPTLGGTFFTRTKEMPFTAENMFSFARDTLEKFISSRTTANIQQTMKIYVEDADYDRSIGQFDGKKHLVRAVIPTLHHESGPDMIEIPTCTMLSMAVKCDYDQSEVYFRYIWNKAMEMGFQHDGPVCIAGLHDLFFQSQFPLQSTTLRLMLRTTEKPDPTVF